MTHHFTSASCGAKLRVLTKHSTGGDIIFRKHFSSKALLYLVQVYQFCEVLKLFGKCQQGVLQINCFKRTNYYNCEP